MEQEFRPQDVEAIIEEALQGAREKDFSPNVSALPERSEKVLFSLGDTLLLENLHSVLSSYLEPGDISVVCDYLREELCAGIGSTDIVMVHRLASAFAGGDNQMPYWNVVNPDVVFVSDFPPKGKEDDDIFVTSLKDAGFSSMHCCWDFVVKSKGAFDESTFDKWRRFFWSEIRIWRPKLIVTLGANAWSWVSCDESSPKLSDICGQIFWAGPWAILPTYSPSYVAQSKRIDQFITDLKTGHAFVFGD